MASEYKQIFKIQKWLDEDVEKAIRKNMVNLCEKTYLSHLMISMEQEGIIAPGEHGMIMNISDPILKHREFYDLICRKANLNVFECLLKAMDASAQSQLSKLLLSYKVNCSHESQTEQGSQNSSDGEKLKKTIILLGPTGVGKSHLSNCIFQAFDSNMKFKTSAISCSETAEIQRGSIELDSDTTIEVIDTPGFFDTHGEDIDKKNMCTIWKAMECESNIAVVLFIFNDRFTIVEKSCYEKLIKSLPRDCHGNIIIIHNKFHGSDQEKFRDLYELQHILKNNRLKTAQIGFDPSLVSIKAMVKDWSGFPVFSVNNLDVPEICYETEERSEIKEKFDKDFEDLELEKVTKALDHSGIRVTGRKWQGGLGKVLGIKKDVKEFVTDIQYVEETVPVKKIKQRWAKYRIVYRVRFDGTKDIKREEFIEYFYKN